MHGFNAHPPIHHHSSECISPSQAQQLLAGFLEETTMDPSLHPNAILTEDGPVNRSSSMGLVLHNLKRVEAGLRGELLAADLSFKRFDGEGLTTLTNGAATDGQAEGERSKADREDNQQADWQDKEEYEREQAVEQGEVGSRKNVLGELDSLQLLGSNPGEVPAVKAAGSASKMDKEARKLAKKEKRKREKRERERER
ncbi:MAG: hypothetical protein L6R39_000220 [Caloplaca ligustica]|nr:MAG: hypothetical protein L6R39_000220 [Caloplaca ligustica]